MSVFLVSRWECVHCGLKKSSDSYLLLRFLNIVHVPAVFYLYLAIDILLLLLLHRCLGYTLRMRNLHGCPGNTALESSDDLSVGGILERAVSKEKQSCDFHEEC